MPHRQPEKREMIAAISVFSQRRAFRRSTSIARRWGHKSIWATRSALVFALRLLRLCRRAVGRYWRLLATEYQSGHKKAARGSLQPELALPAEKVSGQSTNIARRWGHKSIWATRSASVFALRLLRLCRAAIGPYWSLPATEYQSGHKKAARGSLQPELAFPSERKVSCQGTNIARRWGHKSIWATRSVLVFALRLLRLCRAAIWPYWSLPSTEYQSGHAFGAQRGVRLPDSGRVAGARQRIQRFRVRVAIQPVQGPVSAQLARKSQG